jgi:hypothetical protein
MPESHHAHFQNRIGVPLMSLKFTAIPVALLAGASAAWAHEGHGLEGGHWHATDTLGFLIVALLAVAGVVAWWRGRP